MRALPFGQVVGPAVEPRPMTVQNVPIPVKASILRNESTTAQGRGAVLKLRLKALAAGAAQLSLTGFDPATIGRPAPGVNLPVAIRVDVR